MLTESVTSQAIPLAPIRIRATTVEATVARRIRRCGSIAIAASGVEGTRGPGLGGRPTAIFEPIEQAKRPVLPELDEQGLQAEAGPMGRPRDAANQMPRGILGHPLFQGKTALQGAGLLRRPGADLAAAGSGREIGVRFLRRRLRHQPFEADLAAQ